jgi:DNA-binding NarL/FixJ family response regulator
MHDSEQLIKSVANAGARGYVLKADAAVDLPRAIQAVLNGQTFFTPKAARVILDGFMSDQTSKEDLESLTPIQRDILHFVVEGRITKDIAALLQVSTKTVEKQRINLMRRFRCHSRSELVRHAIRNHLVRA